ncbi:HpcH/HpaI aldolase/citrate lyase family protein [Nocardia sp. CA-129566]|uniref:HpcH/HpaI aldolase/citrate lyase family protein n=1 Tax=Nocardia sp. CA-129566 TaxID=3239976 RepID=UPI003D99A971
MATTQPATGLRSCLFVPASNERLLASARTAPADMIIIDLEDSVIPQEKKTARQCAVDAISSGGWSSPRLSVRVNAWESPWLLTDVAELVRGCRANIDSIMLPKTRSAVDVICLDRILGQLECEGSLVPGGIRIDALIEDAAGFAQLDSIASAGQRLRCLCFGAVDHRASMGFRAGAAGDLQQSARLAIVGAARANDKLAVDGPFTQVRDAEPFRVDMMRCASEGFDGRLLLHPAQIEIAHAEFVPTAEETTLATRIVSALDHSALMGSGVAVLDGVMVDEATQKWAQRIIARIEPTTRVNGEAPMKGTP